MLRTGPERDEAPILAMSHLDTVHPVGTLERDLPVRLDGDRLYGPGVYDMKGGAWLALEAFKEVARKGTASRPIVFLVTPDEEIGSPISRSLIEDFGRRAAFALVTEPARDGGKIVTSRKGIGRFEVHVEGRPAHSGSRHEDGRSAIREAARQVLAIEGMTDYGRGVTTTVGMIQGGSAMNTIPQHCRFGVDLRVVTVADGEEFEAAIHALKPHDPDVRVTVTGGMNRPPSSGPKAWPSCWSMPECWRANLASSSARSRVPGADRTATSRPRSGLRPSTASASTATERIPCRNTASSRRSNPEES